MTANQRSTGSRELPATTPSASVSLVVYGGSAPEQGTGLDSAHRLDLVSERKPENFIEYKVAENFNHRHILNIARIKISG